jgi:hypothetical protein
MTALRPRFLRLDARVVFPLGAWLLHWSWPTFWLALGSAVLLAALDWAGLPPEVALERLRAILAGRIRPARDVAASRRRALW